MKKLSFIFLVLGICTVSKSQIPSSPLPDSAYFIELNISESNRKKNTMKTQYLKATTGVFARAKGMCTEFWRPRIYQLKVIGIRNDEPIFEEKASNGIFTTNILYAIGQLRQGDKIFFEAEISRFQDSNSIKKSLFLTLN